MRRGFSARPVAVSGLLAALAVVILCLGTVIPVATYVCPLLCAMLVAVVSSSFGTRMGWCHYACVALLGLLLARDREAAVVFLFFGYYPVIRIRLEKYRAKGLLKFLFFQVSLLLSAGCTVLFLGLPIPELTAPVVIGELFFWALCNLCLFMADKVLARWEGRHRG